MFADESSEDCDVSGDSSFDLGGSDDDAAAFYFVGPRNLATQRARARCKM